MLYYLHFGQKKSIWKRKSKILFLFQNVFFIICIRMMRFHFYFPEKIQITIYQNISNKIEEK